jgi:hypothetical protein
MHAIKILVLAGLAATQFPPRPEGQKILRSKFHENVTISYKEVKHPGESEYTTHELI